MDRLYCQRKEKLPNETGSVLIGSYDFAHNICYIVDAIDSPSDSKEYPDAYIRGSNGLYEKVCKIENAVNKGVTHCKQSIDATNGQTCYKLLNQLVHSSSPFQRC